MSIVAVLKLCFHFLHYFNVEERLNYFFIHFILRAMNVTTCAKSRHYDKKIAEYVLLERRGILPSQAASLSVSDLASCLVDPCDPKMSASVPVHPDRFQRNFLKSATLSIAHAVMPSTVTPSLHSSEAGFASAPVPAPPSGSRPKKTRKNRRRGFRRPVSQGVDRSVGTNEGSDDISPLLRFHVSSENSFVHPRSRITSPSQQFEVGNVPVRIFFVYLCLLFVHHLIEMKWYVCWKVKLSFCWVAFTPLIWLQVQKKVD